VRELHVVAVSEDGRHVLLAGRRGATEGGFRVALDERLSAAVRGELPRPGDDQAPVSELTPKQIQARLRAGESAEAIALAAGVPVARVERFSGPVQGEMARMIDAARDSYLVRGRRGRSAVPLGDAVDAALAHAGALVPDSTDWSTRRDEDGCWVVTVTWFARKRSRSASWRYDPAAKQVSATDPASAALGHLDPDSGGSPPRPRPAPAAPARPTRAARTAPKPATRKPAKAAAKTTKATAKATKATAKATKATAKATKATGKPASKAATKAAKPATKPASTRPTKAATTPPTKATRSASKTTASKTTASRTTASKAAPAKRTAAATPPAATTPLRTAQRSAAGPVRRTSSARRVLRVVPDPAPARARTAAERDGVKSRTSVPAWADVLLGTTPGSER
jgi:hypothetical protein